MKYQNVKTGFVFDSDSECTGEDWVKLSPSPAPRKVEEVKEEKEEKPKRTRKNGNSK